MAREREGIWVWFRQGKVHGMDFFFVLFLRWTRKIDRRVYLTDKSQSFPPSWPLTYYIVFFFSSPPPFFSPVGNAVESQSHNGHACVHEGSLWKCLFLFLSPPMFAFLPHLECLFFKVFCFAAFCSFFIFLLLQFPTVGDEIWSCFLLFLYVESTQFPKSCNSRPKQTNFPPTTITNSPAPQTHVHATCSR